jgi:hypothetical protein
LEDLAAQLPEGLKTVANARVHGTTRQIVEEAWERERPLLGAFTPMPMRLLPKRMWRLVPKDAYLPYQTNRYCVPWQLAGAEVYGLGRQGVGQIFRDESLLARHELCWGRYQRILIPAHHEGMPYGPSTRKRKARMPIGAGAPPVEQRDLAIYERAAA